MEVSEGQAPGPLPPLRPAWEILDIVQQEHPDLGLRRPTWIWVSADPGGGQWAGGRGEGGLEQWLGLVGVCWSCPCSW